MIKKLSPVNEKEKIIDTINEIIDYINFDIKRKEKAGEIIKISQKVEGWKGSPEEAREIIDNWEKEYKPVLMQPLHSRRHECTTCDKKEEE